MRSGARERWRWFVLPAIAATLLVTGCTDDGSGTPTPEVPSTPSADPARGEPPWTCSGWSDAPAEGGLEVYRAYLQYDPDIKGLVRWTIVIYNRSDLMAVGMTVTLAFTLDGKDVTDQVDPPPSALGHPVVGTVDPRENTDTTGIVNLPPEWGDRVEFTATVAADDWCIPTP